MCASRARGGPRARPSHATTHPNNHQLHIVLNELRTDEHGNVIVSALLRYYKSFAVRSEPFPGAGIPARYLDRRSRTFTVDLGATRIPCSSHGLALAKHTHRVEDPTQEGEQHRAPQLKSKIFTRSIASAGTSC